MSDPIDFEFHKFRKETSTILDAQVQPLRRDLERAQSKDVSKLNGRELRKLRDQILKIKMLLLVCDPVTREQMSKKMDESEDSSRMTFDELAATLSLTVRFL